MTGSETTEPEGRAVTMATSSQQQGGSNTPAQQPQQQGSAPQPPKGKPVFKDWASI